MNPVRNQNFKLSKVCDVVKFMYSTYTETRNEELTFYVVNLVSQKIDPDLRKSTSSLLGHDFLPLRLWISTRMPSDGVLHRKICKILG